MIVADQRILRGVAATLSWQNVDSDGTAATPAGVVTVGVTSADGTVVVAPGTATGGSGSSARTLALTAAQTANLGFLTATWTDAGDSSAHITTAEIVGGYFFSLADARASDATLVNTTKYSDANILAIRRQLEDDIERICGVAFVPRYRRQRLTAHRGNIILPVPYPRVVRSIRFYSDNDTYTALTATQLADLHVPATGVLGGTSLWESDNAVVEWEHGYDQPPPALKARALEFLRYLLNRPLTAIPDRATTFAITEGGTYSLATATMDRVGMPDMDSVFQRWSEHLPQLN